MVVLACIALNPHSQVKSDVAVTGYTEVEKVWGISAVWPRAQPVLVGAVSFRKIFQMLPCLCRSSQASPGGTANGRPVNRGRGCDLPPQQAVRAARPITMRNHARSSPKRQGNRGPAPSPRSLIFRHDVCIDFIGRGHRCKLPSMVTGQSDSPPWAVMRLWAMA